MTPPTPSLQLPLGSRRLAGDGPEVGASLGAELGLDQEAFGDEEDAKACLDVGLADELIIFQRPGCGRLPELAVLSQVQRHAVHRDLPLDLRLQVVRAGEVGLTAGLERFVLLLEVDQDRAAPAAGLV